MGIKSAFQPRENLTEQEVNRGLKLLNLEGMTSLGFFSITTSGFLAAFALALGANNLQIGILAAIPFIVQPLQIPVILLVEYFKRRKIIAVSSWFIAQALWFPVALIPYFIEAPGSWAISALLILMAVRGIFSSITSCSWNSWIRDLIPPQILGRFFSKRLALATVVTVVFSLAAGYFVDYWPNWFPAENPVYGYTIAFLFGAFFLGMASPVLMSFMPEPEIRTYHNQQISLKNSLSAPLRDSNYRQLMKFLLFWTFASNLAIPFFAVYLLKTLGYPISTVIVLSVLSQLFNLLFLRIWGQFVDRFGSKVILSLCASLFLLVILGWVFTTFPGKHILTLPLLIALHIFAGIATAGITLNVGMIGLKIAPQGESTSYLAGASLSTSLGTGIGPLVGGLMADFFAVREFTINLAWAGPGQTLQ
jgi:MFS family permease